MGRSDVNGRGSRGPLSEVTIDFSNSPWVHRRLTQSDFLRSPSVIRVIHQERVSDHAIDITTHANEKTA